ncbi:MAG: phosphoribosylamine--glycine ligase [Treponema sp.]|jgi:phosphoribosylamine--glycine ligase|nr:phosphoribosylamine--glycine ligase [Treponema sp.]
MKVLVIGGGGREHAIIRALRKNSRVDTIYAAPGNGGISFDARCINIKADNVKEIVNFALANKIDYTAVIPDNPLALGMVDALEEKGIRCFGPRQAAARIESSKVFAKNLMKKYGIPTAAYETFNDAEKACDYINSNSASLPIVIKADGLALGKGVIIALSRSEALDAVNSIMRKKIFGDSGSSVVIEEYLTGPEVSVLALTDGKTIRSLVSSMDHKRAFDNNLGPNTGGMGAIAPNPYYTPDIEKQCEETIFYPTIKAMEQENCPFKGCLYFGLMLTGRGPVVIEYNCRFGDPETQAVLPLLGSDLFELMEAVTDGTLHTKSIILENACSSCVVLASGGYPASYKTGYAISGLDEKGRVKNAGVFHAGTTFKDGIFYTSGGRVLGVTATAPALKEALNASYKAVEKIHFEDMHFRKDIGLT